MELLKSGEVAGIFAVHVEEQRGGVRGRHHADGCPQNGHCRRGRRTPGAAHPPWSWVCRQTQDFASQTLRMPAAVLGERLSTGESTFSSQNEIFKKTALYCI